MAMKPKAAKKVKVVPKPKALWGCVSPSGEIYSWTIRHEKAESIAEYESGSGIVFEESEFSCVKLHVAGFDSVGNPKPKVVPQAGETEYVVINPGQVEKIEEAIRAAGSRTTINLQLGDDFWRKFWAGCAIAKGYAPMAAVDLADDLAKRFKEGK